ncbi:MAG TPA: hypothetical protein VIX81_01550 [Gammaproteobacteria bacterium]
MRPLSQLPPASAPLLACLPLLLALSATPGCSTAAATPGSAAGEEIGRLHEPALSEASGLALSTRRADRAWLLNDSGNPPELFAASLDGRVTGRYRVQGARNVDWEELVAFSYRGRPHLLIADIGDNAARRREVQLHLVPEPDPDGNGTLQVAATLRFRYPDGPRDAESLAVDVAGGWVLVLSKREQVPVFYRVPLDFAAPGEVLTAERVGPIAGLAQPRLDALLDGNLRRGIYGSSPTGMALDGAARTLVVLTYTALYRLRREPGESWEAALARPFEPLGEHPLPSAEAVALDAAGDYAYVTSEYTPTPLWRLRLVRGE